MSKQIGKILITGGAGFIGSALAARLKELGEEVCLYDSFDKQIHAAPASKLAELEERYEVVTASILDREALIKALAGVSKVVHLAAATGTGQSMYCAEHYSATNALGSAVLSDCLSQFSGKVEKLVFASSRAVYGEGAYWCDLHGEVHPFERVEDALARGRYDPTCPRCDGVIHPIPTRETAPSQPKSIYAATKMMQEWSAHLGAERGQYSSVALRLQNVFGPGQSLSNPYTGILSIFSQRLRLGERVEVFEDGEESRDFVYIDDVVEAFVSALQLDMGIGNCLSVNVGSGKRTSVVEATESLAAFLKVDANYKISGRYRLGDIRHNFADISALNEILGVIPRRDFEEGVKHFVSWMLDQDVAPSAYTRSLSELEEIGLLRSKN